MTFKNLMLESKQFANSKAMARKMEDDFFRTYFGTNPVVLEFAWDVVHRGNKKAAKMPNEYVRVLGAEVDAKRLVSKVCESCGIPNTWGEHHVKRKEIARQRREKFKQIEPNLRNFKTKYGKISANSFNCCKCGHYGYMGIYSKAGFLFGNTQYMPK